MKAVIRGFPIPKPLIHPRWWLDDPEFGAPGWSPAYFDETIDPGRVKPTLFKDVRRNKLTESSRELLAIREGLSED